MQPDLPRLTTAGNGVWENINGAIGLGVPSRVKAPVAAGERGAPQIRAVAAPGSGTASSKALCHQGVFCLACAKSLSPLLYFFPPAFLIKEDYRFPSLSPGFILKRLNDMLTP